MQQNTTVERVTTSTLRALKAGGEHIAVLTAYDYPTARIVDAAGIDVILVGDSLGNVVLGYENTLPVTMEEMLHHTRAVSRGVQRAMVVADMPFMSYQITSEQALANAGRFLQEADAQAVKLEGGAPVADTIRRIVDAGIPVMGHLGYTPQSSNLFGDQIVQAKQASQAKRLLADAKLLEAAGCFAIVLECVPTEVSATVTASLAIPTIGIGAGPHCDGQVLVLHDVIGLAGDFTPKFVRRYLDLGNQLTAGLRRYVHDVRSGDFPNDAESFHMPAAERETWEQR